jgi:heme-degrading monooxygenase HmoA
MGIGTGSSTVALAGARDDAVGIHPKGAPMIAQIAEHTHLPADLDPEYVVRHRAWIARQPGFCGGYHLFETETGRALSVTLWESDAALAAVDRAQRTPDSPADGRITRETAPAVRGFQVAAVF